MAPWIFRFRLRETCTGSVKVHLMRVMGAAKPLPVDLSAQWDGLRNECEFDGCGDLSDLASNVDFPGVSAGCRSGIRRTCPDCR